MSGATAFLGLSHLGLSYSAAWASLDLGPVIAFDPDVALVERIRGGELPVHEPGLPELIARVGPNLTYSSDFGLLEECRLAIVARDVPTSDTNEVDLIPVHQLIEAARPHLQPGATLVLMSQVPPGFTRRLAAQVPDMGVYYWVETLVFGEAVKRALQPERLIIGSAAPDQALPAQLEAGLQGFNCPIFRMGFESAELTKTAINVYLAGAVTYANTMSDLCEVLGADWSDMVPALRSDRRIGAAAYIRPGLGIAGGNIERDLMTLSTLASQYGVDSSFLTTVLEHGARRLEWIDRQLQARVFSTSAHPAIGLWGLTYKKNTRSVKNSPSLRVLERINGAATVRAWDPAIAPGDLPVNAEVVDDPYAAAQGADALLIMCDWDEFARADLAVLRDRMRRALVIDCAGVLQSRRAEMSGIDYVTMGRST